MGHVTFNGNRFCDLNKECPSQQINDALCEDTCWKNSALTEQSFLVVNDDHLCNSTSACFQVQVETKQDLENYYGAYEVPAGEYSYEIKGLASVGYYMRVSARNDRGYGITKYVGTDDKKEGTDKKKTADSESSASDSSS